MDAAQRYELKVEADDVLREVRDEIVSAAEKHGDQMDVPLGCSKFFGIAAENAKERTRGATEAGTLTWMDIAMEEVLECFAEEDLDKIRAEAIQACAMFVNIVRRCDIELAKSV